MPVVVTLLCLPCAGASATMYLRWRALLPAWVRVVPVELPGRGSRLGEAAVEDFDTLVQLLTAELARRPDGAHQAHAAHAPREALGALGAPTAGTPFALFGHSMGALLADGIARRLRLAGAPPPVALLLSGSPSPARRDVQRFAGPLDDAMLLAELRRQGGTPDAVRAHAELRRLTLDTLRADYRVCGSCRVTSAPAHAMPLHLFAGRDDAVPPGDVAAWRDEAAGPVTFDTFDGGHFFLRDHEAAFLGVLARRLSETLASTTAGRPRAVA